MLVCNCNIVERCSVHLSTLLNCGLHTCEDLINDFMVGILEQEHSDKSRLECGWHVRNY